MLHHYVQAKLIASLRGMVASQLQRLAWPPPLADSSGPRGAPLPWTPLEQEPAPAAAGGLMKLLEALTQLQRAVQRSSFDAVRRTCSLYSTQHQLHACAGAVWSHYSTSCSLPGHAGTAPPGHTQADPCTCARGVNPG